MANERNTEILVRKLLTNLNYYDDSSIVVDEQSSEINEVKKLLKGASKSGGNGLGYPEFIISTDETPDFLIVVECKADTRKHQSELLDKPKDFAVDGVLHYAKRLSKSYNVIAIAVSGETESSLKISNYIFPKGEQKHKLLLNSKKVKIEGIISLNDYIKHGTYDESVSLKRHMDLMAFSKELHDFMRNYAKLTEAEKPLLVSGTLLALRNKAFAKSFDVHTPEYLQKEWIKVIQTELEKAEIPNSKKKSMVQPYTSISVHPELGKVTTKHPKGVLFQLIKELNDKVWPFISVYNDFDVVGQFYGEFLKYTGGDKKALGIVLTPKHITELFSLLANVQKDSKVLDICAGTGGFLISAMHQMMKTANTNQEIKKIKKQGLIGIEQQPNMFTLASSNMILRGDGKANLYQGDCFDKEIIKQIKAHKCNIGFLNPPYSQSGSEFHELKFVKQLLDCLECNGTGIVIVPMSCAISQHPIKEEILKFHTLDAVMSMPNELFYPVGTVTCIMVFKAHIPHNTTNLKSWFGYWKNDGFVKTRKDGRCDEKNKWVNIRKYWVNAYRNKEDILGKCIKEKVKPNDEWCAEAYIETNYLDLFQDNFTETIKKYVGFKFLYELLTEVTSKVNCINNISLKDREWRLFPIIYNKNSKTGLFNLTVGTDKDKVLQKLKDSDNPNDIVYEISNTALNNGINAMYKSKTFDNKNTITLGTRGNDFKAFYHENDIIPVVRVINLKSVNFVLNEFIAMFLCTIFEKSSYKFSYGRVLSGKNILKEKIKLPIDNQGNLDWLFMENYIKSLPYSKNFV